MRWTKTITHQTSVEIDGKYHVVTCEEDNEEFALFIDGEYICDVDKLPTKDEIAEQINQQNILEDEANMIFAKGRIS